jgi:hypothetical protein
MAGRGMLEFGGLVGENGYSRHTRDRAKNYLWGVCNHRVQDEWSSEVAICGEVLETGGCRVGPKLVVVCVSSPFLGRLLVWTGDFFDKWVDRRSPYRTHTICGVCLMTDFR